MEHRVNFLLLSAVTVTYPDKFSDNVGYLLRKPGPCIINLSSLYVLQAVFLFRPVGRLIVHLFIETDRDLRTASVVEL